MERKNIQYKVVIFVFVILSFSSIFSSFFYSISDGNINVNYYPDGNDSIKVLILPPTDFTLSVQPSSLKDIVVGQPFYFKDFHLLPLKPYKEKYSLNISYKKVKNYGKVFTPDKKTEKILSSISLNSKDLKNFIKPRTNFKTKSLEYDGTPLAKIKITGSGFYRIYYDDIKSKSGVDLSSYDPKSIKVYNKNVQIPINIFGTNDNIFGEGDYFEFYGERLKGKNTYFDKFQLENVYVIVAGGSNGIRYVIDNQFIDDSLIDSTISSYLYEVHIENDSFYQPLGGRTTIDTSDLWFMSSVNLTAPYEKYIYFKGYDTIYNIFNFSIYFHGFSYNLLINPDHILTFNLNDSVIDTIKWDDLSPYKYVKDSLVFNSDSCKIRFELVGGDTLGVGLNYYEYSYMKNLILENGRLDFKISNLNFGTYKFHIKGLTSTDVKVYRNDLKNITNFITVYNPISNDYDLYFTDQIFSLPVNYSVYQNTSFLKPDTIEIFRNNQLDSPSNEGNFVIIVDQKLKEKAKELADLFSLENKVFLAGTDEIYDQFNYGFRGTKPIKDFLISAYNNWNLPPTHVLLLGDGSYDNNNHLKILDNSIPAPYYYESSAYSRALVASDNYFATIVGDDPIEDISVSRFPARDEREIQIAIDKIKHYLDWKNSGAFNLKFIFAYDTTPPGDGLPSYVDAKYQSYKLASMMPDYIGVDFMANLYDNNGDFLNQLNYGTSILNIYSHGASQSIGSGVYMRISDVLRMNNINRLPFVKVYSCDTGYFDELLREQQSIGEAFVLAPSGGAIAYYGSATASTDNLNNSLGESNFRQLAFNGIKNIGEIILYGELNFFINSSAFGSTNQDDPNVYEIKNYGLLGINLLDLKIPDISEKTCSLSSYQIYPKDTLVVIHSDSNLKDGFLESVLIDSERKMLVFDHSDLINGYGENTLYLPDTLPNSSMILATLAYTKDTSILYISYPTVGGDGVKSFYIQPSNPDTLTEFRIYAKKGGKNIKNLVAYYKYPSSTYYYSTNMVQDSLDSLLFYTNLLQPIKAKKSSYDYFNYYISYTDSTGNINFTTFTKKMLIPPYPDARVFQKPYLSFEDGSPALTVKISNGGEREITSMPVGFYKIDENDDTTVIGIDTVSIKGGETKESKIKIDRNYFGEKILVFAAKDTLNFPDKNFTNNKILESYFDYLYAYIYGKEPFDSAISYHNLLIFNKGQEKDDTNLIIVSKDSIVETDQNVVILGDEKNSYLYRIDILDPNQKSILSLYPSSDLLPANILKYDSLSNKFILSGEKIEDTTIFEFENNREKFVIGRWSDTIPPLVKIFVENKEVYSSTVLVNDVNFGITVEDNEGVDTKSLQIVIDDDTLSSENDYRVTKESVIKNLPVKISKFLDNGNHSIKVHCNDIYGNWTDKMFEFQVSNQFKFINVANFPNPVTGKSTRIVCELSKNPQTAKLKIFKSSGDLFKTYNLYYLKDRFVYTDLSMDGFSNGSYFYYVEAESEGEKIKSKIQKMSVIR
uniref:Gingipain domain-containing protein n=1 Tax=candidate division WOR-3 bacterium TaxID=2052148 RepID=A0A7C3N6Z1_UNCW3